MTLLPAAHLRPAQARALSCHGLGCGLSKITTPIVAWGAAIHLLRPCSTEEEREIVLEMSQRRVLWTR